MGTETSLIFRLPGILMSLFLLDSFDMSKTSSIFFVDILFSLAIFQMGCSFYFLTNDNNDREIPRKYSKCNNKLDLVNTFFDATYKSFY